MPQPDQQRVAELIAVLDAQQAIIKPQAFVKLQQPRAVRTRAVGRGVLARTESPKGVFP